MEVLLSASSRARALVTDLLAFSRVSNQEMAMVPIDLMDTVQFAMDEVSESLSQADGLIEVDVEPKTLTGDKTQVRSLILNLLSNAIKYRSEDRQLVVTIKGEKADQGYKLSITDNGLGFDEKYAKTIFEPFRRLHSSQSIQGTGIGLAICHSVVERHGWTIVANPRLGAGTKFTITMPK